MIDPAGKTIKLVGVSQNITARKQAEEARAQTNAQLEGILGSIPEPVMVMDANGHLVRSNHVFERRHLITAAGELGEYYPVVDVFTEDGHPVPPEMWPLSRAIRGERISGLTLRLTFRNGGPPRFYRYSANPIYDGNGRVTHAVVVFFDVTENRFAEEAQRESEERLRLALTAAELGTWDYDPVTGALVWDARCKELFGLPPEIEVNYDMFLAGLDPDDRERTDQVVQRTFDPASDGLFDIEYRTVGLRDGGVVRWVHATGRASFNAASQAIRFIGTVQDITARKRAEEALRLTQASVDGAAEMVAWFTPDGRVHYANDATCRALGYSREELVQMSALDFSPGFTWEQYHRHWEEVRKRKSFTLEVTHRRKDGTEYPAEVLVDHVVYGGHEYIFAYGRDITERKSVEEALRRSESEQRQQREFLATLLANAPYGISVHKGRDLVYELVNPAYQAMVGSDIQLVGRPYREVFPEAAAAGVDAKLQQVIETGEPWIVDRFSAPIPGKPNAIWDGQVVRLPGAGDEPMILAIVWDVTELAATEEALRASEERFRLALKNSTVSVAAQDRDLRYIWAYNQRSATPDQIIGRLDDEIFAAAEAEHVTAIKRRVLEEGIEQREQMWLDRPDGRMYLDVCWEPIRDQGGRIVGVASATVDLTPVKLAEEALRRTESRWNAAIESFASGAIIATEDERVIYWNPAAQAMHGFTSPGEGIEPLEKTPITFQLWTPDGSHMLELDEWPMRRIRRGETVRNLELRIRRPDQGWEKVFSYSGTMVDTAVGERLIFLTCRDLTELRKAEEALAASESRLRALLESAAQGVVAVDEKGRILLVNARTEELFGYSRDELIGQPLELLVPEPLQALHAGYQRQYFASPRTRQMGAGLDLRGRKKDGGDISMEISLSYVEEGGRRLALALITDVTERKQAEERLRQTQKLESLGLLAGGVAHDFNNLLVGVIGNASLAQELLPSDHPAAELLDAVLKTGEQAAHLTRQMLAYSGKGKFLVEPLDLSALVPDMCGLVRPSIAKKIALQLDLEQDLPPIEADRGQVQQVFMNLALNAAEAIGSHEGLISVRTGIQDLDETYMRLHPELATLAPGKYVCLEVRDTGSGMDEATKAKIFDPFFSTKFTGRGLGLAAVSGILRGHRSGITVSSAPGKGSCFTVLFPATTRAAGKGPVVGRDTSLRGAGTVLVVDDEQLVRELAKRALERHGYTVLMADGGPAAIDVLKRHPGDIALVVLDLSMPNMSGEETLPELRKIRPDVKVLVSSGYSEAESLALFRGQRVSGFIQKPYTAVRLADGVRVCLA
jgi:PAS domain S-box-containing protein